MSSAWQDPNGPLNLAKLLTNSAPQAELREPVRITPPSISQGEADSYSCSVTGLKSQSPASAIRQSGFAPHLPTPPTTDVAASEPALAPLAAEGPAPALHTFDQTRNANGLMRFQDAHSRPEAVAADPIPRKMPIWAPPHVRVHAGDLPVAEPPRPHVYLTGSDRSALPFGLQVQQDRGALHGKIKPALSSGIPAPCEPVLNSQAWRIERRSPEPRLVSPRMAVPIPDIKQRG